MAHIDQKGVCEALGVGEEHSLGDEYRVPERARQELVAGILDEALVLVAMMAQEGMNDGIALVSEILDGLPRASRATWRAQQGHGRWPPR